MKLNLQITKTAFTEVPKNHKGGRGEKGDIRKAIEALAVNEKAEIRCDAAFFSEEMKKSLFAAAHNATRSITKKEADGRKYFIERLAIGANVYRVA